MAGPLAEVHNVLLNKLLLRGTTAPSARSAWISFLLPEGDVPAAFRKYQPRFLPAT